MTRSKCVATGALLLAFASVSASAATLPPNLRRDIDAGNRAWLEGLEAGDATRIVAAYASDSVNCTADGQCVRGPAATEEQYENMIRKYGRAKGGFVHSETLHVDHDLAYESGTAEALFANGVKRSGRFSTVWKRQRDGHWKIFRNLSLPAAP